MKKFLLLTLGIGFFAASCGSKEPQMSSSNTDSTAVDTTMNAAPPVADTMRTTPTTPNTDSIKTPTDTVAAPVTR